MSYIVIWMQGLQGQANSMRYVAEVRGAGDPDSFYASGVSPEGGVSYTPQHADRLVFNTLEKAQSAVRQARTLYGEGHHLEVLSDSEVFAAQARVDEFLPHWAWAAKYPKQTQALAVIDRCK